MTEPAYDRPPLGRWFTQAGLDAIPILIYIYTADGLLAAGNAAAETFWRIPNAALIGKFNILDRAVDNEADSVRIFRQVVRERVPVTLKATRVEFNGIIVWHDMTIVPLCDDQGLVHYIAYLCIDVSESVRRQQDVARAEDQIVTQQARITELEAAKAEIQRQRATIEELSAPLIDVWPQTILLPMIGTLSRDRMRRVVERLLPGIVERKAKTAIIDLTGIPEFDADTARQLLQIRSMIALLGAECVLAGIQAPVARTLAGLELDLGGVHVFATLSSALERCVGS